MTAFYLDGQWLKPDTRLSLDVVAKKGYRTVEFGGKSDALLCSTTLFGDPHAEYLVFHGLFADLPIDEPMQAYRSFYGGATTGASTQMGLEL